MRATIDTNGIISMAGRQLWASAGRAARGRTPGGAEVRWFDAIALPAATLTPTQEGQKAAGGTRVYGRLDSV